MFWRSLIMKIKYVIRILSLQKEFLVSAIVNKIFMIKWEWGFIAKKQWEKWFDYINKTHIVECILIKRNRISDYYDKTWDFTTIKFGRYYTM